MNRNPVELKLRMVRWWYLGCLLMSLVLSVEAATAPTVTGFAVGAQTGGTASVSAVVTANGDATTVVFSYGLTSSYGKTASGSVIATAVDEVVTVSLTGLVGGQVYKVKVDATNASGAAALAEQTFTSQAYAAVLSTPTGVDGGDGTATFTGSVVANGTPGSARFEYGLDTTYGSFTPAVAVLGTDNPKAVSASVTGLSREAAYHFRLVFTPTDLSPVSNSADVKLALSSERIAVAGKHGGILKDSDGDEIGYFKVTVTEGGAFSGWVYADGERKSFSGRLTADGKYHGTVEVRGDTRGFDLAASVSDGGASLEASFGGGRFSGSSSISSDIRAQREDSAGRYTLEFSGGGSSTDTTAAEADDTTTTVSAPEGSGWAVVKVGEHGTVEVKGRLADGRGFSTTGILSVIDGSPTVTFFDNLTRTRIIGSLIVGDAVSGTVRVDRNHSSRGLFRDGYDVDQTVSGARYVQPNRGQRTIEGNGDASGRELSITMSGGNLGGSITRGLWVDRNDRVQVVDRGSEHLDVKFDRKTGSFNVKFKVEEERISGAGVFIQGTADALGRGAGVFWNDSQAGKIVVTGKTTTSTDTTVTPEE